MRIFILCVLLTMGGMSKAVAATLRLHEKVTATLRVQGLTGAVWTTIGQNGEIEVGAAGLKDAQRGLKLKSTDRVQVGSIAKPLIATGIFRLVTLGHVSLEDTVTSILPDVVFDNPWEATNPVRVRHLLDQTSGLDDARIWQVFTQKANHDTPLSEVFTRDPAVLRIRSRPGTRFSYSNMGYTLVGMVIEAVTEQRYEKYLDQHLLAPLGMHDSTFGFVTQEGPFADARLAMGHFENGIAQPTLPLYLRPAGQFTTSAADMGKFAFFLMSDGRIRGKEFIAPSLLKGMGRTPQSEASMAGLRSGYGLGLYTRDRNGIVGGCHGGSTLGYRAMLCVFPDMQRAYFYSINTDSENTDRDALDRLLLATLNMPVLKPQEAKVESSDLLAWAGYYIPSPNRFASFAWLDTVFNFVSLTPCNDGLNFEPFMTPVVPLRAMGNRLFRAPDRVMASHALLLSAEGERVLTTGSQSYVKTSLAVLLLLWGSLVGGVIGVAWLSATGLGRLLVGTLPFTHPAFAASLAVLLMLLLVPLFIAQPFMQLGDLSFASGMLTVVTFVLPMTMVYGLWMHWRRRRAGVIAMLDMLTMLAVLQFTFVLAGWGLLPFRLWA